MFSPSGNSRGRYLSTYELQSRLRSQLARSVRSRLELQARPLRRSALAFNSFTRVTAVEMEVRSLRTNSLFLLLFLIINTSAVSPPWILSVTVQNVECGDVCNYRLDVKGDFAEWSLTHLPGTSGSQCLPDFVGNKDLLRVPLSENRLFFCAKSAQGVWFHQGTRLYLDAGDVTVRNFERSGNTVSHDNLETFEDSIENDIDSNDLLDDVVVNNGQRKRIGDVLIETFSYKPQHSLKYVMENEKEVGRDSSKNEAKSKGATDEIKDAVLKNEGELPEIKDTVLKKEEELLEKVPVDLPQDGIEMVPNENGDETKIVEFETYPDEDLVKLLSRSKRQVDNTTNPDINTSSNDSNANSPVNGSQATTNPNETDTENKKIRIMGLRVEETTKEPSLIEGMIPSVLRETKFTMRLFGENLSQNTVIAFTHTPDKHGEPCNHLLDGEYKVGSSDNESALLELLAPPPSTEENGHKFYICARNGPGNFIHQGQEPWKILATHNKLLPLWASLILIVILLMLASLFSGLNLGLMALDRTELKIIANTGTEKERRYARAIMPVRAHGNYLLCTILLSNVAVNSTFTVILDDLTSGLVAVIGSTLAIVFIAEITPQAICARHGLFIGAKSIWIMKIVMGICAPLAWPTSKLLDYFLGEEIGTHYNRERLKELVRVTDHVNDLDREEVNIISGALDLRKKKVSDVMTKLKDCFMLPVNSVLDFETMSEIVKSGYSRIPVYEGSRGNIVTVLFIKDLAFVDPDDNTPLRTLCQYYQNPCNFVFEDVTLDVMLKQFKEGHKGHMAFVQRIEEGDGDPVYETIGLVTLEDVIEEMIQAEIVDETDVISDNRTKKRLARPLNKFQDLAAFAGHHEHQRVHVSPQLVLATFQFLNTSVDPFRPEYISENVLRRLLKQDVIQHIKLRGDEDKKDLKRYVFQEGKPVDYFVLILEGRVEVTVGRENLVFEAGPFTYFGVQALTQNVGVAEAPSPSTRGSLQNLNMDSMLGHTFVPDYSVRAIADLYYLAIKRTMYLNAKRATLMEKGALNKGGTNEQIEPEVDKLLREGERIDEIGELDLPKQLLPASASPFTNSSFRAPEKQLRNPEEETLLKKK